ncbi:hypothetical protein QYE76_068691 [Lolium multiflorum]|uniref:Uncharacterized protein n=1 Tax=Lolium multiflorum TaxID=4521 RepID=A0AAD8SEV3_LOLMU|nr:hypothetical protein QYE76_068691 [Lolium multiflorum]
MQAAGDGAGVCGHKGCARQRLRRLGIVLEHTYKLFWSRSSSTTRNRRAPQRKLHAFGPPSVVAWCTVYACRRSQLELTTQLVGSVWPSFHEELLERVVPDVHGLALSLRGEGDRQLSWEAVEDTTVKTTALVTAVVAAGGGWVGQAGINIMVEDRHLEGHHCEGPMDWQGGGD